MRRWKPSEKLFEIISCGAGVEIGGARLSTQQSPPDKRLDTMFQRVIYHKPYRFAPPSHPTANTRIWL